ncbi:MAG: SDR family oxidoreductase [Gammaproteobacteria bacterium]|nr:SDR family oxidoreductase [Gammaproteobacteria bacterium]MDH3411264.1 SDR family oxidoreductase [Gammaproteobacteria bacterium]
MSKEKKTALVTGANRGIGLETCRQLGRKGLHVILTCRKAEAGKKVADKLKSEGMDVEFRQLDVTDAESIDACAKSVDMDFGRLDVLVNNAGIMLDSSKTGASIFQADPKLIRDSFETNALGPLMVAKALVPLMRKNDYGRIVNLSSGMGQLSGMDGGYPGYRISKTALNAVTVILSREIEGTKIKVNSVCPGWVRTDMGSEKAPRSLEEGADTVVWLATLPDDGPSGGFFRDRKPISW